MQVQKLEERCTEEEVGGIINKPCLQIVRNRLQFAILHARRTKKKKDYRDKTDRFQFAPHPRSWNNWQWMKVLFTDECRFCLKCVDGRKRVWMESSDHLEDLWVEETDGFGGGSLMIWGGKSTEGITDLVVIEGGLTAERYVEEIIGPEKGLLAQVFYWQTTISPLTEQGLHRKLWQRKEKIILHGPPRARILTPLNPFGTS